jgi:hypothetical protein
MVVTAYDPTTGGATYMTDFFTVATGGSKLFMPADFAGMPDDFAGSAVVSSSADIRAIVNLTNRYTGALGVVGGLAAGQYQGTNTGATSLQFPLIKNNYYSKNTTFYVQNAGTVATVVTATFYIGASTYVYVSPSFEPGRMVAISPSDAGVPSDGLGSLKVTSNPAVPLAGVALEHKVVENPATILQASRGLAPTEANTKIYAPIIKNNYYGRFTGLQVMNASAAAVNITVSYKSSMAGCDGFSDTKSNIQPNTSATFVHLVGQTTLPYGCLASATVTATGNVIGLVNESYTTAFLTVNPGRSQESVTYAAFSSNQATTKISLPLYKEDSYSKSTGLAIQNVGAANATNVVITFVGPTGTYKTVAQTIPVGGSLVVLDVRLKPSTFWDGTPMTVAALGGCLYPNYCGANGLFGVTITSDQPVVAIANESTYPWTAPRIQQDKNNYEGFNLVP